ncbi:hypothetical protein O3P69_018139 [Scylla paramamosain]|uniref:Uncharacterized protein n=1 Tax=Scylla paramamosain TaxID=85552 RepID=A0AAW0TL26_SCYPA
MLGGDWLAAYRLPGLRKREGDGRADLSGLTPSRPAHPPHPVTLHRQPSSSTSFRMGSEPWASYRPPPLPPPAARDKGRLVIMSIYPPSFWLRRRVRERSPKAPRTSRNELIFLRRLVADGATREKWPIWLVQQLVPALLCSQMGLEKSLDRVQLREAARPPSVRLALPAAALITCPRSLADAQCPPDPTYPLSERRAAPISDRREEEKWRGEGEDGKEENEGEDDLKEVLRQPHRTLGKGAQGTVYLVNRRQYSERRSDLVQQEKKEEEEEKEERERTVLSV